MQTISFVIPVFRNEGSLALTYQKIISLFEEGLRNYQYEIIFVNDGSDDNSLAELLDIKAKDADRVTVLSFTRNFGQVPAIIAGFREAQGACLVNMSADLQDPPELIVEMVRHWEQQNKVVVAYRIGREDTALARLTSKVFYNLMKLSLPDMPAGGFDFVLLDRQAYTEFNAIEERNRFFQGDILWLGFGIKFLPYKRRKREIGRSQWTLAKKVKYFIDGWLNTSYLPIRFMSFVGMSTSVIGFLYLFYVVYARLFNKVPFRGYAFIVTLILVIGGLIMLMLGIIGEYTWRIYDETRDRKTYIIEKKY